MEQYEVARARTNVRVRTKVRTKAMTTVRARTKVIKGNDDGKGNRWSNMRWQGQGRM